jgi:hypothetical protein
VKAFDDRYKLLGGLEENWQEDCLAAALEAVADQVAPVTPKPNDTFCCPPVHSIIWERVAEIRRQLLAIAAELDGGTTTPTES